MQGDILSSEAMGTLNADDPASPPYWMVITKDCDLAEVEKTGVVLPRKQLLQLLPVVSLPNVVQKIISLHRLRAQAEFVYVRANIRLLPMYCVEYMFRAFRLKKRDELGDIIRESHSRFAYLPKSTEQGLLQPHVVDFSLGVSFSCENPDDYKKFLAAKQVRLTDPFRYRVAQRHAAHFSSIGFDGDFLRSREHIAALEKVCLPKKS